MNILILGDIVGPSGREAIVKKLPNLIKKKKLDFVIINVPIVGHMLDQIKKIIDQLNFVLRQLIA